MKEREGGDVAPTLFYSSENLTPTKKDLSVIQALEIKFLVYVKRKDRIDTE